MVTSGGVCQPKREKPDATRAAQPARASDHPGGTHAPGRARLARRAGREDRPCRRHAQTGRLSHLRLQGGDLRLDARRLPRRARGPQRRGARTQGPGSSVQQACLRYVEFCLEYPAFMDCALSPMQRPADGLREQVSDAVWVRLGQALAACVRRLERILAAAPSGVFAIEDPASQPTCYTQMLGRCSWRASAPA